MRAHTRAVRLHLVRTGLDRVRKQAIGHHHLAIGYRARIGPGIERAAEAVIRYEKTSDEAYCKPMYLDAETDAILHERCRPMSRRRLQATATDGYPPAGARHGP